MVPEGTFSSNLAVVERYRDVPGCIVECGTWRGGMIAAIAELLGPARRYYLFDSFEGLPRARAIDGAEAIAWQSNPKGASYFDNCTASESTARAAMSLSGATDVSIVKGWFSDTLPEFTPSSMIAVLRLDADWFDSTLTCLESLYPLMSPHGVIIVDDYYMWDGCSRAVHQYLAQGGYAARVMQTCGVCTIQPNFETGHGLPAWTNNHNTCKCTEHGKLVPPAIVGAPAI